jgi:hypothetical protein
MSDVETSVESILKPMLKGRDARLGEFEQITLAAWITLRTMILERAATVRNPRHYYTHEDHRLFADYEREGSLEPTPGTYIWLFHFKDRERVANSNVANIGFSLAPGEPSHHAQLITAFVGQFGFQTLTCRWPKTRSLELERSRPMVEWAGATRLLWPYTGKDVVWALPYLAGDTLKPFTDRFNKGLTFRVLPASRS